jgi:hypothetical protein
VPHLFAKTERTMTLSGPPGSEPHSIEDENHEVVPPEAEGMAATVLLCVTLVLAALAPFATRAQPAGKAWYLAPVNWPLFSLGIAVLSGGILAWRFLAAWRRAADKRAFRANALWAFGGLGFALEHGLYFCLYMLSIAWIGFAIATFSFMQFVIWRAGLRGPRWVLAGAAVTIAVVVIFRLGIGLWFPLAPLFKLFPDWAANTLGGVL